MFAFMTYYICLKQMFLETVFALFFDVLIGGSNYEETL